MAACSCLKQVNVHVYERTYSGFKRICCFDSPEPTNVTIYVLYQGGVHYDALVPESREESQDEWYWRSQAQEDDEWCTLM